MKQVQTWQLPVKQRSVLVWLLKEGSGKNDELPACACYKAVEII
jgi:hypothetical protein